MQSTHEVSDAVVLPGEKPAAFPRKSGGAARGVDQTHAVEEISAYISIRDGLLREAEKSATCEMLRRASIANDFVETCLQPARSPYEAQFLSEADAVRE